MVTLTQGTQVRHDGVFQSTNNLTQSTATTPQAMSVTVDVNAVGMGTATGFGVNIYTLGSGVEGQSMIIVATATGEAKVSLAGTATGDLTFTAAEQIWKGQWVAGVWQQIVSGATLATATS